MTELHDEASPMNPLAFSTLGAPGWSLQEVADWAVQHGFSGVELRAAAGEPVHAGLTPMERRDARALLADAGVHPLAIASYVTVADPATDDGPVIAAGIAHGVLASDLGAEFLRIFPGGPAVSSKPSDAANDTAHDTAHDVINDAADAAAIRRLRAIQLGLADTSVTVALETHDSHSGGRDVARILHQCPGVAAIWDILHTWRAGETPAQTVTALGKALAYVQVKDVASREDLAPLIPGAGILPLNSVANALRANQYHGYVSWEYEKAWCASAPALTDLGVDVARRLRGVFTGRVAPDHAAD
ncbi:MAG: TIM barrel protein [Nakamurella sp.]